MTIPVPPPNPGAPKAGFPAPHAPLPSGDVAAAAGTAAASQPAQRGWWRRNGIALIALAVLLSALGGFLWWDGWNSFYGYGVRPTTAISVSADDTATIDGTRFGPVTSGVASDTSGMNLPADTTFYVAIIDVDPMEFVEPSAQTPVMVACLPPALVQQSTGRTWTPLRTELGIPYASDEPDRCDVTATDPYKMVVGFIVPDDVEGPFWLDVDPMGDGRFIRFSIDP